jgi:DNA-binding response OmpR family regulator
MIKILILEDESSIRSFVVINLKRAGYEVIEAETGEEAPISCASIPMSR